MDGLGVLRAGDDETVLLEHYCAGSMSRRSTAGLPVVAVGAEVTQMPSGFRFLGGDSKRLGPPSSTARERGVSRTRPRCRSKVGPPVKER